MTEGSTKSCERCSTSRSERAGRQEQQVVKVRNHKVGLSICLSSVFFFFLSVSMLRSHFLLHEMMHSKLFPSPHFPFQLRSRAIHPKKNDLNSFVSSVLLRNVKLRNEPRKDCLLPMLQCHEALEVDFGGSSLALIDGEWLIDGRCT